MHRNSRLLLISSFVLLTAVSCQKIINPFTKDRPIGLLVGEKISASSTKSQAVRILQMKEGGYLEETVSDFPSDNFCATKGAVITTDGYNAINTDGLQFTMNGWLGSADMESVDEENVFAGDFANHHFLNGAKATRTSGVWGFSSTQYWRVGVAMTFWSYFIPAGAPEPVFTWPSDNASDEDLKTINFDYSLPNAGSSSNDAEALQDFLIAYNCEKKSDTSSSGDIDITFRHPLSAIKFTLGTISGDSESTGNEYVEIRKVELVDVAKSGSFTATGEGSSQCTFSCTPGSEKITYSQTSTRDEIRYGKFSDADSDFVMFMIPQNTAGVKVRLTMARRNKTIYYKSDGVTVDHYEYSSDLKEFTRTVDLDGSWESGKYYTYKINSTVLFGGEEITINAAELERDGIELVDGNIHLDVSGQSTGFSAWVAPLDIQDVNILKLTINHTYKCNSQKSQRTIWLSDVVPNPNYTGAEGQHKNKAGDLKTTDEGLVAEVNKVLNDPTDERYERYKSYWPYGYTGLLGNAPDNGGKYIPLNGDNNMNTKGSGERTSTYFFYLGGKFKQVMLHFYYIGDAGDGSWTVEAPVMNITEVVERI